MDIIVQFSGKYLFFGKKYVQRNFDRRYLIE